MPARVGDSTQALHVIARSATRRGADGSSESRPLSKWNDLDAFVLLAEPGGGKSEAFKSEARTTAGSYVKARDFANLGAPAGWCDETLFIDGFDEMRADSASRSSPLDAIVSCLGAIGRPRFRLSCREADWLLAVDQPTLRAVAAGGSLDVLYLDPLNDDEILELLHGHADRVPDAQDFVHKAQKHSLEAMLRNPLLLKLLVDAVGDNWPAGRAQVYERACKRMAQEHDEAIAAALGSRQLPFEAVLDAAGCICAVLLLSGTDTVVTGVGSADSRSQVLAESLRSSLNPLHIDAALNSKLFVADDTQRLFRHRSIAEYLAARALGRRVTKEGLPISRVTALMCGSDGGMVEPLRGLNAWLSVTCPLHRRSLIDRDPLGCVLYGDAHGFDVAAKLWLLEGLRREAERFVWFRNGNWASHPFGALGTSDMASEFGRLLASTERSPAHQSLLECVLEAIEHGEPQRTLWRHLEAIVKDNTYRDGVRNAALDAWLAQPGIDLAQARGWLEDIRNGCVEDARDELCGRLLRALYPNVLAPAEVLRHFHATKAQNFVGWYRHFWWEELLQRTPVAERPTLADGLASGQIAPDALRERYELPRFLGKVVGAALETAGSSELIERIATWLSVGIDAYGFAAIKADDADPIRAWLTRHPDVQKRLMEHEFNRVQPDSQTGRYDFWSCRERLFGAALSRDWYRWLLEIAARTDSPALAEHCISEAAVAVLHQQSVFDISMEDVEHWISSHLGRWPQAQQWLEPAWSLPLDHWRGAEHRRQREYEAQRSAERAQRRAEFVKHLALISAGVAPPGLMHNLAIAYRKRFTDIRGETPEERVQDYLGGDAAEAQRAIAGLEATLDRSDLPSVEEILAADLARRLHYIREVCLLGADLACARNVNAPLGWGDELTRQLVAFRLTHGTDQGSDWYDALAAERPQLVADVLRPFAEQCLRNRGEQSISGLWPLARDEKFGDLARLVIPELLASFPERATPAQRRHLNTELLPAAIRHLSSEELKAVVAQRLAMPCLDSGQRIAWLVVGLRFAAHRRSGDLFRLVCTSRVRIARLAETLDAQSDHAKALVDLPPAACAKLLQLLAPGVSPEFPSDDGWVGATHRRRDLVRGMINQLSADPEEAAGEELDRLRQLPLLQAWRVALDAGRHDHVRQARSARFQHASAVEVATSIAGGKPASALDLAALASQNLDEAVARIRGEESNILGTFWRSNGQRQRVPRVENECRDRLLAMLRPVFVQQGILLNKESQHAGDTRADLRAEVVAGGRPRVVPIEIKKDDHPNVWTAWHSQLDHQYTTHPAAEGVGIYLVLWFGHRPRRGPNGEAPRSAVEMRTSLMAAIPFEDRVRLTVRVLDLSLPMASPALDKKAATSRKLAVRPRASE